MNLCGVHFHTACADAFAGPCEVSLGTPMAVSGTLIELLRSKSGFVIL